jgi:hypothetical protein
MTYHFREKQNMKNIENYVCTLKQSKMLEELGAEQESLYYWADSIVLPWRPNKEGWQKEDSQVFSAFTGQELLELIIKYSQKIFPIIQEVINGKDITLSFEKEQYETHHFYEIIYHNTEAQARADFLISLLENKNV